MLWSICGLLLGPFLELPVWLFTKFLHDPCKVLLWGLCRAISWALFRPKQWLLNRHPGHTRVAPRHSHEPLPRAREHCGSAVGTRRLEARQHRQQCRRRHVPRRAQPQWQVEVLWIRILIFFGLFVIPILNLNPLHMDPDPQVDPDP